MLALGVAGSAIGGFFAHAPCGRGRRVDRMAAGSPFQLEVAFSNLALGILGVLASADGHAEEPATLGPWHDTVVTAAAHATAVVAATLSLGYAVNQSAIGAAVGSLLAAAAITHTVSRAARRHG